VGVHALESHMAGKSIRRKKQTVNFEREAFFAKCYRSSRERGSLHEVVCIPKKMTAPFWTIVLFPVLSGTIFFGLQKARVLTYLGDG
jgi:hypothetical protein